MIYIDARRHLEIHDYLLQTLRYLTSDWIFSGGRFSKYILDRPNYHITGGFNAVHKKWGTAPGPRFDSD